LKKLSQEYEEKLNMPEQTTVIEETKEPTKEERSLSSDRSRENSGTLLELDPNAKVLNILREHKFLSVLKDCIETCDVSHLENILRLIKILHGFRQSGFYLLEQAGVQDSILVVFEEKVKEGVALLPAYEMLGKLCKMSRSNRVRVTDAWEFFIKVTQKVVENGALVPEARLLLAACFRTISNLVQGHSTNIVQIHDAKGFEVMKEWYGKLAAFSEGQDSNECMEEFLSLTSIVLSRIPDKAVSHEHGRIATELILFTHTPPE
jgi:hypothetical protein